MDMLSSPTRNVRKYTSAGGDTNITIAKSRTTTATTTARTPTNAEAKVSEGEKRWVQKP